MTRSVCWLAIFAGFMLTIVSWLGLCSAACAEQHTWHLIGVPLEVFGFVIFPLLALTHYAGKRFPIWMLLGVALAVGSLGAEVSLILIQKVYIRAWCPVCLGIAACVGVTALTFYWESINQGGTSMSRYTSWIYVAVFLFGFFFTFLGIEKENQMEAAIATVKNKIWLGNPNGDLELYLFTDWSCPACRKAEPEIEKIASEHLSEARMIFVDFPIHPATYNYSPFNASFQMNNKPQYVALRHALTTLSEQTEEPTVDQIKQLASQHGAKFTPLTYAQVNTINRYFRELANRFGISSTPTLVIVNTKTGKQEIVKGSEEIQQENISMKLKSIK
ncbi:MAG: thioredoxin domain-containing protein [Chlamydiia bacterium]|nr:thioredoxin domain-containing protein [Chlamydiia bacterium]